MEDRTRSPALVPRLCHIVRWPDFNGYGFNLHAEKGKAGQFIGKVDSGSPAEAAGLREGDRIVEVNGINIGNENHQQVVGRIKSGGDETRLLVVDAETDVHYKSSMTVVRGDLPEVCFMTASRDEQITSSPTNGSAAHDRPASGDPTPTPTPAVPAASPHYPVRQCQLRKWADFDGYGFNLHAEKDRPGQFIGVVDPSSPAERGGLREGDRIVEVNGENIESLSHGAVIGRVKAGGDRTELLVVDREADNYYTGLGVALSSKMVGVTVIATPPTSKPTDTDINSYEQSSEPATSSADITPSEELAPDSLLVEKTEEVEVANAAETEVTSVEKSEEPYAAEAEVTDVEKSEEPYAAESEVTKADDVDLSTLPEPNVSLSDEESEPVTAAVADTVETSPQPQQLHMEETLPNGHEEEREEEEKEKEEEKERGEEKEKEEEKEAVVVSTQGITQAAADTDEVVVVGGQEEEEEKEVAEEEVMADLNAYEQVEVVAAAPSYSSPPAEEDLGRDNLAEEKIVDEIMVAVSSELDHEEAHVQEEAVTEPDPVETSDQPAEENQVTEEETLAKEEDVNQSSPAACPEQSSEAPESEVNGESPAEEGSSQEVEVKMNGEEIIPEPESLQQNNGPSSYGVNGGSGAEEPQPVPTPVQPQPTPVPKAPEPEPVAVIPSAVNTRPAFQDGGLELHLSAAEMKERLKARKKQDPRFHKTSFEAKSKMFEKL